MSFDLSPLWISLKTAGLATLITFFLGIAAAYWMLGYRGRWKSVIEGLFISPLILPPTVVGFLLLLLFGNNGPFGSLLASWNFTIVFTWYAAVIAATVVAFPLMYKTALGAFEQIEATYLDIAQTLGASKWKIFWAIAVPLALPGILAGAVLAFARALGEFGATLMLAGNIPGQTQTIPMAIYFAVEAGAMTEAWWWVLVILSISLSGLIAVNIWQGDVKNQRRKRNLFPGKPLKLNRNHQQYSFSSQNSQSPKLDVDIQKQLSGFSLRVSFGVGQSSLGLLGSSGVGKSMVLRCIAGIETPTSGRIVLNGRVLFDSNQHINVPSRDRHIGFLVQNYGLFPHLTVTQNIAFGLPQRLSKLAKQQQVEAQLTAMQLQGLGDRYPHQLSGGQQQRVALARALVTQPAALLLDEPFSALDTHLRSQMEQQMIASLSTYAGVTLLVTHNLEEAYRLCDNLLVLDQGRVIAQGTKQSIFEHPKTVTTAKLTGCKNFSRAVAIDAHQVDAVDWQCRLTCLEPMPATLAQVGIRAHQLVFVEPFSATQSYPENTFPCWLSATSETPHRMTLYLKLHSAPNSANDYHVQAEVFKERWNSLKEWPLPWVVYLDPMRLVLLEDNWQTD
jgi:molybdate ABC transporter permease protein